MPKGNKLFNIRDCGTCGAPVIDAYDEFTGSSFPVDAQPHEGVLLTPPSSGKRNAIASRGDVYVPHVRSCEQTELGGEEEEEPDAG